MKTCRGCKKTLPLSFFNRRKDTPDGLQYQCTACRVAHKRAWRKAKKAAKAAAPAASKWAQTEAVLAEMFSAPEPQHVIPELVTAEARRKAKEAAEQRRQKSLIDSLLAENTRLHEHLNAVTRMVQPAPSILVYKQPKWERADAIACALASDWHVDEVVRKEAVHGLNEYNPDIARLRAEKFFLHYLKLTNTFAKETRVRKLFIQLAGDFFSGWIHEELMHATAMAPGDAARFCLELLFAGFDFLLRESSYEIEALCIPGNHGRMTKQVHHSNPTGTSLETFMYHALAARYADNPRVKFRVSAQSMVYTTLFENFVVRSIHGYEVKYGGGVGGLTIPLNKAIAAWDVGQSADLTCLGHFHQRFDGGRFLVNGSSIGYGTYSQAIKAAYEEAVQTFFLVHARGGGEKSVVAPIWLDDNRPVRAEEGEL